ncbi:MAG: YkvA family protein, partial [Sarcina sp.]
MQVSQVEVKLSSQDVFSIINDIVKIKGLIIDELNIRENIEIKGCFKKIVSLGFKANVSIIGVSKNYLSLKLVNASLMSIGILAPFRKLALKIGLKGFKEQGIIVKGDEIIIDIDKILEKIPFLNFDIYGIWIENRNIKVDVRSINVALNQLSK